MPGRCAFAPENEFREYEVRKMNAGADLLLFTVDDDTHTIWAIGFRHGRRLSRPEALQAVVPDDQGRAMRGTSTGVTLDEMATMCSLSARSSPSVSTNRVTFPFAATKTPRPNE